jgi:hypothetical protein
MGALWAGGRLRGPGPGPQGHQAAVAAVLLTRPEAVTPAATAWGKQLISAALEPRAERPHLAGAGPGPLQAWGQTWVWMWGQTWPHTQLRRPRAQAGVQGDTGSVTVSSAPHHTRAHVDKRTG